MRRELQRLMDVAMVLEPSEIPQLLGEIEEVRWMAFARLLGPKALEPDDRMLSIDEAAQRLGVSVDYLYRHAKEFEFARKIGRKVLFSSRGINCHIAQNSGLTAKRHDAILDRSQIEKLRVGDRL